MDANHDEQEGGTGIPEIRIRKSSDAPSLGEAKQQSAAPLASFEALSDLEDDSDTEHAGAHLNDVFEHKKGDDGVENDGVADHVVDDGDSTPVVEEKAIVDEPQEFGFAADISEADEVKKTPIGVQHTQQTATVEREDISSPPEMDTSELTTLTSAAENGNGQNWESGCFRSLSPPLPKPPPPTPQFDRTGSDEKQSPPEISKAENFMDFSSNPEEINTAASILDQATNSAETNKAENFLDFAAHPIIIESENVESYSYAPNSAEDFLAYAESSTAQNFNTEDDSELVGFDKSLGKNGIPSDNFGLDNNTSGPQEDTSVYTQLHSEEETADVKGNDAEPIDTIDTENAYEEYNFTDNLDAPIINDEPSEEFGKITITLPGRPKSPKVSPAWVGFDDLDTIANSTSCDVSGSPRPSRPSAPPTRPPKPSRPPKPKAVAPPRPAPPRPNAPPKKEDADGDTQDGESFDADDQSSLTEKKTKSKSIIPKKVKGLVTGKKDKKEKKEKHRDIGEFKKFTSDTKDAPKKDTEEWEQFQAMLDRSKSATVVSQIKLTKMETEYENELEAKLNVEPLDPWANLAAPGEEVPSIPQPEPIVDSVKTGWIGFEDDFSATAAPALEPEKKFPVSLGISPIPSPRHNPIPPNNSRRESIEGKDADLLGLTDSEPAAQATSDLLGIGVAETAETISSGVLHPDIMALSRNVGESSKSSECSSPTQGLDGLEEKHNDDAPFTGAAIDIVDEFLGIAGQELKKPEDPLKALLNKDKKPPMPEPEESPEDAIGGFLGMGSKIEETISDDDPFGLGSKPKATTAAAPVNMELFIVEEGDLIPGQEVKAKVEPSKELHVKDEFDVFHVSHIINTQKAVTPSSEDFDFDPRSEHSTAHIDVKPAQDTKPAEKVTRVRPRARPKATPAAQVENPFKIELVTHDTKPRVFGIDEAGASGEITHHETSMNPFASAIASKNPFTQESTAAAGGASLIAFADDDDTGFETPGDNVTAAEAVSGSFNPFATITDVDAPHVAPPQEASGTDPDSFDPFQTIHGDDAFEFELPKEDEGKTEAVSPNRFNPFNKEPPLDEKFASFEPQAKKEDEDRASSKMSSATVSTEEEDEDLEPLPPYRTPFEGECFSVLMRQPIKKKLTANRFWKKVCIKIVHINNVPVIKVYPNEECKEQIHELPIQPSYQLCNMGLQTFDQFGKCHTVKLQYVFYRERVGVKAERIAPTLSDLTRVRDFKSLKDLVHKPKATMLLDHAPQASELIKFGGLEYNEFKSFIWRLEDSLFKLEARREKPLSYTKDEITVDVIDEYYADINAGGHITYHKARVRIYCLAFLTGMPFVEVGINDKRRRGKEVVGRHDIIPIKTEEWIRIEDPEFYHGVDADEYSKTKVLKFKPLDACQYELMRFRVRPRQNKELPLQIRCQMSVIDRHVEIRTDVMIPGYYSNSRRASQTPCEDIMIRFPIPETWIYLFRVEKRFRYGSVKSHTRKAGKIKGLERLTMMAQGMLPPSLIEVSTGSAKYEHIFHSIIWRINRLPERNEGAYKTHLFTLKLDMGPHDIMPESFERYCYVDYNMPNSTMSRAQVRSISINPVDENPDKWVHHLARYEYKVEMEFTDKPPKPPVPQGTLPENCISPIELSTKDSVEEVPEEEKAKDSDTSDSSDSD